MISHALPRAPTSWTWEAWRSASIGTSGSTSCGCRRPRGRCCPGRHRRLEPRVGPPGRSRAGGGPDGPVELLEGGLGTRPAAASTASSWSRATPASARPRWRRSWRSGSTPPVPLCCTAAGTRRRSPRTRPSVRPWAPTPPRPSSRSFRADPANHAEDLARLLPDLGACIGGVRAALVDDPDAERRRLFDAVTYWLGAISARHPVLLVLDDLQWAERSSLLLLRHVLDDPPPTPPCWWS